MKPWVLGSLLVASISWMGCTQRATSGRATAAMPSVAMEPNQMLVRPTEVQWTVGAKLNYQTKLKSTEVLGEVSPGGVFFGGPLATQVIPVHVRLAATKAVVDNKADGVLLTHYLVKATEEVGDPDTTYDISLFGRLLTLSDLGPLDEHRADELEGLHDRLKFLRTYRTARDLDAP